MQTNWMASAGKLRPVIQAVCVSCTDAGRSLGSES